MFPAAIQAMVIPASYPESTTAKIESPCGVSLQRLSIEAVEAQEYKKRLNSGHDCASHRHGTKLPG